MLCVLGEVTVRDEAVDLGPARQRCLLAALAVEGGRVVAADRLVERVWGAQPPRRGRATLYSYLSRLRQALAGAEGLAILHRSGGYLLTGPVDLHRFRELTATARAAGDPEQAARALTEALALWRGEALTGLDGEWAEAERERLGQERLAAERDLADARLALGHGDRLVAELAAQAANHPLDERVAGQYMTALHQAGRTADALAHYRLVHTRLAEELGTDPGAPLRQVHNRLLAESAEPGPGTRTARQLPAAPRPFVGRSADLARLDAALDAGGTVVISAIAGAGGIGKTWLALHWAHRHAARFPDGQFFVDLRGFSPDSAPMDPAAAMRGFLDALGVEPHRIPLDPHAQAALFRGLVAGKRMLLVLDNAADTRQVTPLLPGSATCTVLVTSRFRLTGLVTGHAARHLPLDVLSGAEARALLTDRLGAARTRAEESAVERLIALCGGFPLALSIVAAHAHTRPHRSLAALADELAELGLGALADDDPTASLPAVLSWSHHALTPAQASAFALLGVAPGPDIGLAAAAALVGEPAAETRRLLLGLEQASLLAQDARGRYRMHDLIRRYAADTASRLPEGAVAAARNRVVGCYLHTAFAANRLENPHRAPIVLAPLPAGVTAEVLPDERAALAWFDAEHPCLLAALDVAGAAAWDLAWTLETFHRRRGHFRDRLAAWRTGLAAAEHRLDPAALILTHRLLGRAHADLGRHDEGIEHLHRALALAEAHADAANQTHTHRTLAAAWVAGGEPRKGYDHAVQALRIARTLANPVWEAGALNAVGWYAAQLGEHDHARENCEAALTLFRAHEDAEGQATTLDSLGFIADRTGRHEEAVSRYRDALTLLRAIGSLYEVAGTLDRIGSAYAALTRHRQAREAWEEALELYRRQGRDEEERRVRRQLDALPSTRD
ncbi:tetratricopeptide repeat protein [Amycolatopsis sp. OK19-0408]|uniref:Tetratricopeptide repeat protein n=1 Tax=Amycolatopsis iheyensis TaxID=2945988 RepID=A0A9X2NM61_9PSEU|nr:BTAD domain-containing putative transcriptional regulator [Amycolatopsis iheyensis]MCR6489139.1 tetratricopeptide repeat protein [Amycolatopsis iheyensis]